MKVSSLCLSAKKVIPSRFPMPPVPPTPLAHFMVNRLAENSDNIAFIDGTTGATTTRGQLREQILRFSGAMKSRVKPDDVVAVSLPNIPQFLLPVLGSIHAGAQVCLYNPIYTEEETGHAMSLTKPKFVVTTGLSLPTIQSQMKNTGIEEVIVVGPAPEHSNTTPFTSMLQESCSTAGIIPPDLNTTALMPFSSGTTGMPKAVCLSHRNVVSHLCQTLHPVFGAVEPGMNMMCLLPMFHMYGMTMTLTALCRSGIVTSLPRFELGTFLNAIQTYKIQHVPIVPPIATVLAKHPDVEKYDLSSVIAIPCASAPLSKDIQNAIFSRINVNTIRNGYGMSEMVAAGIVPHPDNAVDVMKKGSIGEVMAGMEARIIDVETGEDLGPDQEGEILLRGPNVMKGYLGDAGATAATVDNDGWIHTGDVGKYDENNDFFITDRLKELIKHKGWQVAPAELEGIILSLPGVQDAGVIGVPAKEEGDGDVPKAFVVRKPGSDVTSEDIVQGVADKVAKYKELKGGVVFVEILPRSLAGKLLRKELRKA
eukprot:GFUD01010749.1.p1 GENE.GFUD01010749.1~~GFUD01010749.1.p1  ORF type:complete len:538 (+),score=152.80 GFUD01010749.1:161-1774(+)